MKKGKGSGWFNESRRHALASKGIKTAQKVPNKVMKKPMQYVEYPMSQIIANNERNGMTWFSKGNQRFFNSKWANKGYRNGELVYFVSSEQFVDWRTGAKDPRKYTVRVHNINSGDVNTVGDFQQFGSQRQAEDFIKEKLLSKPVKGDKDGDGKTDNIDCDPNDPTKQDDEPVTDVDDIIADISKSRGENFRDVDDLVPEEVVKQPTKSAFSTVSGRAVSLGKQGLNYASNLTKQYFEKKQEFNEEVQNLSDKQLGQLAVRYRGGGSLFGGNPYEDELVRRERERQTLKKKLEEAKKPRETIF